MLIRVVAVQSQLGEKLSLEEKLHIFRKRPDFICLPEYSLIDKTMPDFSRAALNIKANLLYLQHLSGELDTCLIAGSVVEADRDSLYNSAYLFNRGEILGRYRKLNPVAGEISKGILPGDRLFTAEVENIRIGILICADALNLSLFEVMAREEVDVIFIPTTSPYRPAESKSQKHKRDNDIYVRGARTASAFIVKTCGVGTLFSKPLQGRSLIASPWDIPARIPLHQESERIALSAVLDIAEIRDFRRKKKLLLNKFPSVAP
ncbi:MAG: carbon-nitrogen hydrolase family protein [Candidatus Zixiibacteriota bacterium]|nr:MAG: carbon-nitrogen hydrolase family protein [candidate division Zixibacteria bacterium]